VPVPILVQQVIQRSNDEQMQAISTRNLSLIADTLTADHLPELTAILQDMIDHKVYSIELLKLDWGPIVVAPDGKSAVATTTETWRITSAAGMVEDAPCATTTPWSSTAAPGRSSQTCRLVRARNLNLA